MQLFEIAFVDLLSFELGFEEDSRCCKTMLFSRKGYAHFDVGVEKILRPRDCNSIAGLRMRRAPYIHAAKCRCVCRKLGR